MNPTQAQTATTIKKIAVLSQGQSTSKKKFKVVAV
jgi:hypothetical protein